MVNLVHESGGVEENDGSGDSLMVMVEHWAGGCGDDVDGDGGGRRRIWWMIVRVVFILTVGGWRRCWVGEVEPSSDGGFGWVVVVAGDSCGGWLEYFDFGQEGGLNGLGIAEVVGVVELMGADGFGRRWAAGVG
ncbi:Hypothetical predicted protein [Olea europaea subsp. europaea]|uniref:Uncharacterized protein n=1 Tax=Olea europaea subsp. europaea TaxID=158383 RepID=A0A8S0VC88_OLEEU|nr:Hypothetical predicted protein [Olea europaea subsp. europaea]